MYNKTCIKFGTTNLILIIAIRLIFGDAGVMIDPNDVEALAREMARVLADEKLRKEMSEKGLARAKLFTWEKCARETLKVYEEIAGI